MTLALALVLSLGIGLALGMLGGGGSILTVPILVYALGVEPKRAIATSLLVVGTTSVAALVGHARARRVDWRTGLLFGAAGMAGAFGGARVAAFMPATALLVLFAGVMLATAVAMLRAAKPLSAGAAAPPERSSPVARVVAEGLVVGAVTGMVGAGGGFLVVPALVLFGQMPMERAVGTSLVVIAMKSFAGLAGYVGHVEIEWGLAALVTVAAVLGSVGGAKLVGRIRQATLRRAFGWFVLVMAGFVLARELPGVVKGSEMFYAVFVERWPWYVGGAAIALFVFAMLWLENKPLGVSTGCSDLCAAPRDPAARKSWRIPFLGGIVLGGLVAALLAGRSPTWSTGGLDAIVGGSLGLKLLVLGGAGVLVGYGARMAGGCTSGHSIVGTAMGARSSLLATMVFMIAGFVTTHAVLWIGG